MSSASYKPRRDNPRSVRAIVSLRALDHHDKIAEHRLVTDVVHAAGSPICLQILHAGRYARHDALVGASGIPSPIKRRKPRAPGKSMT